MEYIIQGYKSPRGIGTPGFGDAKRLFDIYLDNLKLKKHNVFLDYGCGDGRLANFIAGKVESFYYYGLEHPQSALKIFMEKSPFQKDKRCSFGLMKSPLEKKAIKKATHAVLNSVFTHISFKDFEKIMKKLKSIINRDGEITFSVFLKNEYEIENPINNHVYGVLNCYGRVFYTEKQLFDFTNKNNWLITEVGEFLAQGQHLHRIFKICKK